MNEEEIYNEYIDGDEDDFTSSSTASLIIQGVSSQAAQQNDCECECGCEPHLSPIGRDIVLNQKIEEETERAIAAEEELEAEISQAGKIDDVKVDGISVVTNKVANISLQPIRDQITAEAQTRAAADTQLSSAISTESSRAQTAENALESKTDAAAKLAESKGYTDNKVSLEATARTTADSTLQEEINNLKARGRFLSLWNSITGLPTTEPSEVPYAYRSGDYFIIDMVGATNYQPSGTSYTGVASTVQETRDISPDDVYYFDGSTWSLQINTQKSVRFASILGQPSDNANLAAALNAKQDSLNAAQMSAVNSGITSSLVGWIPSSGYLKNASVSGITLTLTKHDDSTIAFVGSDITSTQIIIEDE